MDVDRKNCKCGHPSNYPYCTVQICFQLYQIWMKAFNGTKIFEVLSWLKPDAKVHSHVLCRIKESPALNSYFSDRTNWLLLKNSVLF